MKQSLACPSPGRTPAPHSSPTTSKQIAIAERRLTKAGQRPSNVLDIVEEEGRPPALAKRLSERERERAELKAHLAMLRRRLTSGRPNPVTLDDFRGVLGELRTALNNRETIEQARAGLESVLIPRASKLFDEAVELNYTFPVGNPSPLTGTGAVPAAGFEPAIFTLKG
jgi:hypothetical protein